MSRIGPRARRRLGALAVLAVVALAGCTAGPLGPGPVNQDAIGKNVTYDWKSSANASITVTGGTYEAVYDVRARTGGTDEQPPTFEVHQRDALGRNSPLSIQGVKFQYPNGTVVGIDAASIDNKKKRKVVTLPASEGHLAFRSSTGGKRFSTPTFVQGSYEVTLPAGMRVGVGLLARVNPSGYEKQIANNRVTIQWENVRGRSVVVRYYLVRDLWLFAAGALALVGLAIGGAAYYRRQIRELERKRKEVGLDVETESDGSS